MPAAWAGVRGRKGKGAGGGGIESPNTLQSRSVVRILDLLGEGPIGGLANGAESIYFNGVPLMASTGKYNFRGVTWEVRLGLPTQDPMDGFPAVETTYQYGVLVMQSTPQTHTITDQSTTRCAVTIQVPALYTVDTNNGNTGDSNFGISITVQSGDMSAVTAIADTVSGKCTSPYERTYTFSLTGNAPWTVTINRTTADSGKSTVVNAFYLIAVEEIIDHAMIYPDSAYVGITFDSELFGSTLPTRAYDLAALVISVPLNYDVLTRTYATSGPGTINGTWDGYSFQPAVCDNPAWIIYDILQNVRYGFGLPTQYLEQTKFDLYQIGQYCDESIPDGFGGMAPRYTCNVSIANRDDAYNILQAFTSIFRGMSWWGGGTVRITADMPTPVSKIVNQADVIGGNFAYQSTALKTRHSMAIASFIDPNNQWNPSPELYQYPMAALTPNNGQAIAQLAAFGATTRGQAHLAAHWLIDQEQTATETVTYQAGLDHLDVFPGSVIEIMDPAYVGWRWSGRLLGAANTGAGGLTQLTTDSLLTNTNFSEESYFVDVEIPGYGVTGNLAVSGIETGSGGTTVLNLDVTLPELPVPGTLWNFKSSTIIPRQFRVVSLTEPQPAQLEITGLFHDPNKYARIEDGLNLTDQAFYSGLGDPYSDPIGPPSNVTITDYYVGEGTTTVLRTTVSWTSSTDPRVLTYNVQAQGSNGYSNIVSGAAGPSLDIDNLPVGDYVFSVQGVTGDGRQSPWALSQQVTVDGQPIAPSMPLGFTAAGGVRMVSLNWQAVTLSNLYYYEVWRAPNQVVGGTNEPGTFTLLAQTMSTSYTDSDSVNLQPLTTWWYEVRAVSTTLAYGAFAGPVSATTLQLLVGDLPTAILTAALFAQGLLPSTPTLVTSLPGTGTAGEFVVLESNDQLYYWNTSSSPAGWAPTSAILGADGKIVAGSIEAGAITGTEIAAGTISATELASSELITSEAQIGYAVVNTLQLVDDSVTSMTSGTTTTPSGTGPLQGTGINAGLRVVFQMSVSVPTDRTGQLFFNAEQGQSPPYDSGAWHFKITQDGTELFNRSTGGYLDFPSFSLPITLIAANSNNFVVSWEADTNVGLASVSLTAFGRIK
jgi:predicted phage tail protein